MALPHPFTGLDRDPLRPPLPGTGRSARPVPAPAPVRRIEPLAAVALGLHGLIVLANLGGRPWQWVGVGLTLGLGLLGVGGRGPGWLVPVRAVAILAVGVALQATGGGAGGWFVAWPFVLVAVYPLALPGPAGVVVAGLAVLAYVLVVRLAPPATGPALAVTRGLLLAGLGALAWTAAAAYARMANLATDVSVQLGRSERLSRALLDALPDPTAVLDAQGRVVAVNRAWARLATGAEAGPVLAEVGASYPAACAAAAAGGHDGLRPAPEGVRSVLAGDRALFRCRYLALGGAVTDLTVTPLAGGDGAVVSHRPVPGPDPG